MPAILGPDAAPGTPEFDLFIKEVHREMTAKAGQKCTAIRRVIVPKAHEQAVIEALSERLGKTPLGLPDDANARMSALASLGDRQGVREKIAEIAREAEIVFGDPAKVELVSATPRRAPS